MESPATQAPIISVVQPANRQALTAMVAAIETYPEAVERIAAKAWQRIVHCVALPPHAAMLLKQELLALGGDALIAPGAYLGTSADPTPLLGWASDRAWSAVCRKFAALPIAELQALGRALESALDAAHQPAHGVGPFGWRWGQRTLVMGIVNVTPDSFSGDGLLREGVERSIGEQAALFAAAGADILDIGAESTRPGARSVAAAEELARILPAITAARASCDLPISVDTYKAEVAAAALDAGAQIVNDIWGLRTPEGGWNKPLAALVADRGAPIILMHNRRATAASNRHGAHFSGIEYDDMLGEIRAELAESIDYARGHGIAPERIILDPGIGFGKTPEQNIALLRRLGELNSLGYPLLVGTSRKSFIGLTLDKPADERIFGTAATVSQAISHGAAIVRVHDVAAMVDVCRMTDALVR